MLALASAAFGLNHFVALKLIESLIPTWMPTHLFLACLTGAAMIAAGVSTGAKWMAGGVAFGIGTMYLLFVLTLRIPRVLAAPQSPDERSSALIALGMCGASWLCVSAFKKNNG